MGYGLALKGRVPMPCDQALVELNVSITSVYQTYCAAGKKGTGTERHHGHGTYLWSDTLHSWVRKGQLEPSPSRVKSSFGILMSSITVVHLKIRFEKVLLYPESMITLLTRILPNLMSNTCAIRILLLAVPTRLWSRGECMVQH